MNAEQVALGAEARSQLQEPARVIFDWSASEPGGRFRGRGVLRLEPNYKARLDLFLPGGETVARAALVGGDLRVPPGVPEGLIPPPRMLWGAVGVVRPGRGAGVVDAQRLEDGRVRVRFLYEPEEELRYVLLGGRIDEMHLLRGGDEVESVALEWDDGAYPREAVYRNLADFRELRITRDSVESVAPFPPDIWEPGGTP